MRLRNGMPINRNVYLEADVVLLVNVPVSFQFSTILDDHHNTEQKQNIDTDNAKCGREDHVEVDIGKGGKCAHASRLGRGGGGVGAGAVRDKHWRRATQVAAAVELEKY